MRARVGPGIHQILGTQRRVSSQQSLLAGAQTPGLIEKPNGNPGSHDTRFTAANIGPRIDTWKIAIETHEPPT